jgi:ATP-binding protein involved in chromosome partitioning
MSIRENSDAGAPSVAVDPEGPEAAAYRAIARRLVTRIP